MRSLALAVLMFPALCLADATEDAAKLYDLKIDATASVTKGAAGAVTVRIEPKAGAEIHGEAPIKLELSGPKNVTLAKAKCGRADLKMDGAKAGFDVAFTGADAGKGQIDATLSFFICTDKVCAKQERKASLPVEVK